jgi:integrase
MYKRNERWCSDFWYKGERYVKSHGPVSKTVAKEKDRQFKAKVASGDYIKAKNNPQFDKAIDEYLKKSKAENQPSTYRRNSSSVKYLKAHFGTRRISAIEGNEVLMRQYINKRKVKIEAKQIKQGRNPSEVTYTTINRELALLRSMFNVLIRAGKANKNPVALVTMFEEVQKERILTSAELGGIIKTIEKSDKRYHHLKDIIIIALNTAMRKGEILAMKKEWVDLKNGIINVPRQAMKRKKKDKRVPINSAVRSILKQLMAKNKNSNYVFVNLKTGTRFNNIYKSWLHVIEKAGLKGKTGIDKLRFHDLRHTAATNLARAGKDIKFIAQYLGHTDVKTSARYIHYSDEDLKEGSEILAQVPSNFTTPKIVSM